MDTTRRRSRYAGPDLARGLGKRGQGAPHLAGVAAAYLGQAHAFAVAGKERHTQFRFKCADLMADRAVCDEQFVRGARKTLVPGCRLECLDGVERRELSKVHRNFSHIEVKIDRFA
jgi:hypothetical protein